VGVQVRRFGRPRRLQHGLDPRLLGRQVQVYLDGVPLARAQNETVNLADLPLDAVDHVESTGGRRRSPSRSPGRAAS